MVMIFPRNSGHTEGLGHEDVSALLRKSGSKWKVAEIACAEEDNEECLGSPGYFKGLKKCFLDMPMAIIPEQTRASDTK